MIKATIKKDGSVSVRVKPGSTTPEVIAAIVKLIEGLVDFTTLIVGENYDERFKTAEAFATAFDRAMTKFGALMFNAKMSENLSEMDVEIHLDDLDEIRRQAKEMKEGDNDDDQE